MTPKEKAIQLHNKYWELWRASFMYPEDAIEDAKTCAIIAVDEIIEELTVTDFENRFPYWQQVKQEIKNLYKQ